MLLAVGLVALLLVANAMRPVRWTPLVVPCFFAAWLTAELAPQLLVLLLLLAAVSLVLGAGPLLPVGAAACLLAGLGLVVLVRRAEYAAVVADAALRGLDGLDAVPGADPTSGLRRFFVPLAFRHPDVERLVDLPYGDDRRHRLDVYRRRDAPSGCPVLLQLHGGGWVIGDKREQGRPLMLALGARGWVCVAPNYRLSPRATWPDHLVDAKRALAWVREHGREYGADPDFVVVTGGSAGGHLAAMLALTPNDPTYQPGFEQVDTSVAGCVPYYGVYDLAGETGTAAARVRIRRLLQPLVVKDRDPARLVEAAPLAHLRADAPPFLVVHGSNDTLVPVVEARLLVQRLRAVSRQDVRYLELPGTQHAFDVFPSIRSAHVVRAVVRFVELLRWRDELARQARQSSEGGGRVAGPGDRDRAPNGSRPAAG